MSKDALVWQTPGLATAAQAFLLTIGLAGDTSRLGRGIAAVLGVALAYVTCQVMARHRYFRRLDEWQLRRLEMQLELLKISYHGFGPEAEAFAGRTFLATRNSYHTWQAGSGLIGLAHLLILVLVFGWPQVLSGG